MGSNPTAGILCYILLSLLWCRLLCQAQRLYSSVVERQSCKLKVLGSIPSGGYYFVAGFAVCRLLVIQLCVWRGLLRSSALLKTGIWRNGSTSDSRSEGWEFESLCAHFCDCLRQALDVRTKSVRADSRIFYHALSSSAYIRWGYPILCRLLGLGVEVHWSTACSVDHVDGSP